MKLLICFVPAAEAVNAMGLLSKSPAASEDGLLVSENAASSLLSLAAQIALEVRLIIRVITQLCARKCVDLMGKCLVWWKCCHISQFYGVT